MCKSKEWDAVAYTHLKYPHKQYLHEPFDLHLACVTVYADNMYLSHNITNLLIKSEVALTELDYLTNGSQENKSLDRLIQEKLDYDVFYFANNIGLEITLKEAAKINEGKEFQNPDSRTLFIQNLQNCQKLITSIANNKDIPISSEIFAQVNKSLGIGTVEETNLRYREANDQFALVFDDYLPAVTPENKATAAELETERILAIFNQNIGLNRLYRISYLVYQLLQLQPFIAYNKFSISLIADLVTSRLLGPRRNLVKYSEFLQQNRGDILRVFTISESAQQEVNWHEIFLDYVDKNIRAALQKIKSTSPQQSTNNRPFLDLNRRQLKILKYLQTIPSVKREDYVQMMEVSTMTAYRDLQQLVDHKLLKTIGVGRGTKYTLVSR